MEHWSLWFCEHNYKYFGCILQGNPAFMNKIPPGAEVTNVLVGEVDFSVSALVRLANSAI